MCHLISINLSRKIFKFILLLVSLCLYTCSDNVNGIPDSDPIASLTEYCNSDLSFQQVYEILKDLPENTNLDNYPLSFNCTAVGISTDENLVFYNSYLTSMTANASDDSGPAVEINAISTQLTTSFYVLAYFYDQETFSTKNYINSNDNSFFIESDSVEPYAYYGGFEAGSLPGTTKWTIDCSLDLGNISVVFPSNSYFSGHEFDDEGDFVNVGDQGILCAYKVFQPGSNAPKVVWAIRFVLQMSNTDPDNSPGPDTISTFVNMIITIDEAPGFTDYVNL